MKEQALFTQERLGLRPLVRVHTCWLAFLLVVNVTSWLSLWASREHPTWSIFEALLLLLVPILLYIVSYLAVPISTMQIISTYGSTISGSRAGCRGCSQTCSLLNR